PDEARDGWHVHSLAEAERDARGGQASEAARERRGSGGESPADGSHAEDPPASKTIGQPASRQVRERESPEEDRLQEADARRGPPELAHEKRRCHRQIPAIHVAQRETGEAEGRQGEAWAPHGGPVLAQPGALRVEAARWRG